MRNNEIFLFSCWFTALVWTLRSRPLDVELNKLDWNSSNEGSIPISSSKPVHPVGKKIKMEGMLKTQQFCSPVLPTYLLTGISNFFAILVYVILTKQTKTVKTPKTKTFNILEVFLNWQRKTTLATISRVLLQQWRPAASWVVLSLRASWRLRRWELPFPLVSCSWSSVCNFEIISGRKTFLYGCKFSRGRLRWSDWKTTYKEKEELGLFSVEKRESKGNLPAVCNYLAGYSVGYQEDGARLFSQMHSERMGGQQLQAGM